MVAAGRHPDPAPPSADPSIGSLSSQLGHEQSRQQPLSSSIGGLSATIASLDWQIALVQSSRGRGAGRTDRDRAALARTRVAGQAREQAWSSLLRTKLARAKMLLARQLVSSLRGRQARSGFGVVLEAQGFSDLLDKLAFLREPKSQQSLIIARPRPPRQPPTPPSAAWPSSRRRRICSRPLAASTADASARRHEHAAAVKAIRAGPARSGPADALAASRGARQQAAGRDLRLQAQQAAAQACRGRAVRQRHASTPNGGRRQRAARALGGWAIPYAIVLCESGGQNLSPNSAGASGYYQIMPATWSCFGGTAGRLPGPQVRAGRRGLRIWNRGAGAHELGLRRHRRPHLTAPSRSQPA